MRKLLPLALASLTFVSAAHAQTVITAWSFNNDAIAIPVASPAPSTGSGTALSLGMTNNYTYNYTGAGSTTLGTSIDSSDILAGTGTNGGSTDGTTGNIWRIRGGSGTSGGTATANGWSSLAPIGTQGAEFDVNTTGYTGILVTFDWYTATQGDAKLELQYTTNGSTWINTPLNIGSNASITLQTNSASANTVIGSYVVSSAQQFFNGITADLSSISGVANNPAFGIRLVNAATGADNTSTTGAALNNTSGNWRFDQVKISGTAVPEPGTCGLLLGGMAFLGGIRRRRKQAGSIG